MGYTVQPGDSWFKIAGKLYGDQRMAGELQRANQNIGSLQPGMSISTPKKQEDPYVSQAEVSNTYQFEDGDVHINPDSFLGKWLETEYGAGGGPAGVSPEMLDFLNDPLNNPMGADTGDPYQNTLVNLGLQTESGEWIGTSAIPTPTLADQQLAYFNANREGGAQPSTYPGTDVPVYTPAGGGEPWPGFSGDPETYYAGLNQTGGPLVGLTGTTQPRTSLLSLIGGAALYTKLATSGYGDQHNYTVLELSEMIQEQLPGGRADEDMIADPTLGRAGDPLYQNTANKWAQDPKIVADQTYWAAQQLHFAATTGKNSDKPQIIRPWSAEALMGDIQEQYKQDFIDPVSGDQDIVGFMHSLGYTFDDELFEGVGAWVLDDKMLPPLPSGGNFGYSSRNYRRGGGRRGTASRGSGYGSRNSGYQWRIRIT